MQQQNNRVMIKKKNQVFDYFTKPLILGRTFMAWLYFLLAEISIIVAFAIYEKNLFGASIQIFLAGYFFSYFLNNNILTDLNKFVDELMVLNKTLLYQMARMINPDRKKVVKFKNGEFEDIGLDYDNE